MSTQTVLQRKPERKIQGCSFFSSNVLPFQNILFFLIPYLFEGFVPLNLSVKCTFPVEFLFALKGKQTGSYEPERPAALQKDSSPLLLETVDSVTSPAGLRLLQWPKKEATSSAAPQSEPC